MFGVKVFESKSGLTHLCIVEVKGQNTSTVEITTHTCTQTFVVSKRNTLA